MAAGQWIVHDKAIQKFHNGTLDLDNDAMTIRLYVAAGIGVNTPALEAVTPEDGNEVAGGTGYTAQALVTPVVTESAGTTTFDIGDASWAATGAGITARYAAIVVTSTSEVVASVLLESPAADVTAPAGQNFVIAVPTAVFTVARV